MDSASAVRYLQPRPFVIALAAGAATLGEVGVRAYPLLYALVADEVGTPHAVDLPPLSSSTAKSFSDILSVIHQIGFRPDSHIAQRHALRLPAARITTLEQVLRVVLDAVLRSPDGLQKAVQLMDVNADPDIRRRYERDGVIACFLRKVCVAFASLAFDALSRLLHDLRLFVHPNPAATIPSYTARATLPAPHVSRQAALDLAKGLPIQSEAELNAFADLFVESRKPVAATNLAMQSLPSLGRERRTQMTLPSVDYVMQLESQRQKDLVTAVDALHRYYDLSLSEIGYESARTNANRAVARMDEQAGDRNGMYDAQGHQYAALSLGVLHAHFGNPEYASVALDDTIRAAQHCNDDACQAKALSWIARTSSSVARRHQLLRHGNDQLALAKEEVSAVFTPVSDGVPDSVNLHSMLTSGAKAIRTGTTEGRIAAGRIARIQERINYRRPETRVDSLLVSAAAWESHAAVPAALSVAKMALSYAEREEQGRLSSSKSRALAAVASLSALEGDFQGAKRMLEKAIKVENQQRRSTGAASKPELELLSTCLLWLEFQHSLSEGDTVTARKRSETLTGLSESCKPNTIGPLGEDLALDALEARCRVHLACQASQAAAKEAEALCRRAASLARPGRVVEGLRLRAEAHLLGDSYHAALPAVLAAVSLSQGLGLEGAHVASVLTLTETLLRMQEHEPATCGPQALRALQPVLAKAVGGMGLGVRARACRLHAECLMAVAAAAGRAPEAEVVRLLGEAHAMGGAEAEMCLYLLARCHEWRGERKERNAAARGLRMEERRRARRRACLAVVVR